MPKIKFFAVDGPGGAVVLYMVQSDGLVTGFYGSSITPRTYPGGFDGADLGREISWAKFRQELAKLMLEPD